MVQMMNQQFKPPPYSYIQTLAGKNYKALPRLEGRSMSDERMSVCFNQSLSKAPHDAYHGINMGIFLSCTKKGRAPT